MIVLMGVFDRVFDVMGVFWMVTTVVKITRGYPVTRWFL